MKRTGR